MEDNFLYPGNLLLLLMLWYGMFVDTSLTFLKTKSYLSV